MTAITVKIDEIPLSKKKKVRTLRPFCLNKPSFLQDNAIYHN